MSFLLFFEMSEAAVGVELKTLEEIHPDGTYSAVVLSDDSCSYLKDYIGRCVAPVLRMYAKPATILDPADSTFAIKKYHVTTCWSRVAVPKALTVPRTLSFLANATKFALLKTQAKKTYLILELEGPDVTSLVEQLKAWGAMSIHELVKMHISIAVDVPEDFNVELLMPEPPVRTLLFDEFYVDALAKPVAKHVALPEEEKQAVV